MIISSETAYLAGELTNEIKGWTDEELKSIIKFEELFIAFLEGKGLAWWLAESHLRRELDQFRDFLRARRLP